MKMKSKNFNFKYVCPIVEINALFILISKLKMKMRKTIKNNNVY